MLIQSPQSIMQLNQVAERAAGLLGCMANPDRLMLLCMLVEAEKTCLSYVI